MPDQGRAGLPVVPLDVLEQGDVVIGPEHFVQEAPQRTGLLREVDQEVVLEPWCTSDRSTISPYRETSLLPPDTTHTTVAPGRQPSPAAARPRASAPAGSAMMPSCWYSSSISVQTAPPDDHLRGARAGAPLVRRAPTRRTAAPSTNGVHCARRTGPPARARPPSKPPRPARRRRSGAGATARRGSRAMPASRPPPPTGTTTASGGSAELRQRSRRHRALAGDRPPVVERRHQDGAGLARRTAAAARRVVVGVAHHDHSTQLPPCAGSGPASAAESCGAGRSVRDARARGRRTPRPGHGCRRWHRRPRPRVRRRAAGPSGCRRRGACRSGRPAGPPASARCHSRSGRTGAESGAEGRRRRFRRGAQRPRRRPAR